MEEVAGTAFDDGHGEVGQKTKLGEVDFDIFRC